MKWIENIKKIHSKNCWDFVGIFTCYCKCVWVCAYACVGYSCVLMCICVGVSEGVAV